MLDLYLEKLVNPYTKDVLRMLGSFLKKKESWATIKEHHSNKKSVYVLKQNKDAFVLKKDLFCLKHRYLIAIIFWQA